MAVNVHSSFGLLEKIYYAFLNWRLGFGKLACLLRVICFVYLNLTFQMGYSRPFEVFFVTTSRICKYFFCRVDLLVLLI